MAFKNLQEQKFGVHQNSWKNRGKIILYASYLEQDVFFLLCPIKYMKHRRPLLLNYRAIEQQNDLGLKGH